MYRPSSPSIFDKLKTAYGVASQGQWSGAVILRKSVDTLCMSCTPSDRPREKGRRGNANRR